MCSEEGGAAASSVSQVNGWPSVCACSAPAGNEARTGPWKPSQPARTSHSMRTSSPLAASRQRMAGASWSSTAVHSSPLRRSPPPATYAVAMSSTSSCCG